MNGRRLQRWLDRGSYRSHLSETRLLELHARRLTGEREPDGRDGTHLRACASCAAALADLDAGFDAVVRRAAATADAAISPERLARQRDVIARRLDGQPGRLLQFPARVRTARPQRPLRRWVAMAAASGLVFGLAAGRLMGPTTAPEERGPTAWASPAARGPQRQPTIAPALADEHLLSEVDAAIARALPQEFRVLDELTPRVSDTQGRR